VLAATVLAAANSALFGATAPITSLNRAVNRLGARTVGSIAVATGVGASAVTPGVLQDVKFRVWRRSITCALTCQKLGAARGLVPEDAFLSGLLYGFGRSIAIASLEVVLRTRKPPRPLSVSEWLSIAEEQRATLAQAMAKHWQLPPVVAEAVMGAPGQAAPGLFDLVVQADKIALDLDAGRLPVAPAPYEARVLDDLIAGLPASLEAFLPSTPSLTTKPAPSGAFLAKPEQALQGDLCPCTVKLVDRRMKAAASLKCLAVSPTGVAAESSRPFQESSVVRLQVGEPDARFEPWWNVVLCVPNGALYRVELELFSPTREVREKWRALCQVS
jgi:HDOD domain